MIPKIIHYVWLGEKPLPSKAKQNIESWKKHNPDYEIKEWNEANFDFENAIGGLYAKQACEERKYAFASDVIRLYALVTEGGIYLDVDMDCRKSFDDLLDNRCVLGFQGEEGSRDRYTIISATMLCEKGDPFITDFYRDCYSDKSLYEIRRGKKLYDDTPNTHYLTRFYLKRFHRRYIKDSLIREPEVLLLSSEAFMFNTADRPSEEIETENTYTVQHGLSDGEKTDYRNRIFITRAQRFRLRVRFFIAMRFVPLWGNALFLKMIMSAYRAADRYSRDNLSKGKKNIRPW